MRREKLMSAPFAHLPAALHSRSLVAVGALASYSWSWWHWPPCVAQVRSDVALPFAFSYSPLVQTSHAVHDKLRCDEAARNELCGQDTHVREDVLESALILCPGPHERCPVHDVLRWDVSPWYVFAGHAEHLRSAIFESALIS